MMDPYPIKPLERRTVRELDVMLHSHYWNIDGRLEHFLYGSNHPTEKERCSKDKNRFQVYCVNLKKDRSLELSLGDVAGFKQENEAHAE